MEKMESAELTLIELTKKQKIIYALSWMMLGLATFLWKLVESYYAYSYELITVPLIIMVFVILALLVSAFLSLCAFLPKWDVSYIVIFTFAVSAWIMISDGNSLVNILMILSMVYVTIFLIIKKIWYLWIPLVAGAGIYIISTQLRSYSVDPIIFQFIISLIMIIIGVLYLVCEPKKRSPLKTKYVVTIIACIIGLLFVGNHERSWVWWGQDAENEIEAYLEVALPEDTKGALMEYRKNIKEEQVLIKFNTSEQQMRAWIQNGVLNFNKDLSTFITADEISSALEEREKDKWAKIDPDVNNFIYFRKYFSRELRFESAFEFDYFTSAPYDNGLCSYCSASQPNSIDEQYYIIIVSPFATVRGEERWRALLVSIKD